MYGSSDQWLWLVVFIQRILWSPTSKETPPTWYTTPLASQLISIFGKKKKYCNFKIIYIYIYIVGFSDVRIFGPMALACSLYTLHPLESHIERNPPHLVHYSIGFTAYKAASGG